MKFRAIGGTRIAAFLVALALFVASTGAASAHSRFDRAEPPLDTPMTGEATVLKVFFSQELTSKSTLRVLDASGVQVDLGDGRVDLDDPIRKTMLVSLPALPVGIYTLDFVAESAEDGHAEPGTVSFGVGMTPPSADEPSVTPAADPSNGVEAAPSSHSLHASRPLAY